MSTTASALTKMIHAPEIVVMPGVFDPFSAKLAEQAGFPALQCSGAAISECISAARTTH